jgi:hypothetical protein
MPESKNKLYLMTINMKELEKNAQKFFEEVLLARHASKLEDLTKVKTYNINPFLISYIAKSIDGEITSMSIAKALLLPRFFGTSLNTIFGNNVQEFCVSILGLHGSTTSGIDIEYIDFIDGRKKYCQVKAGPQTINKDDVTTIIDHFKKVANLAKTNHTALQTNDMVLGVLYGNDSETIVFMLVKNSGTELLVLKTFMIDL